jgi:PKD repeat protein
LRSPRDYNRDTELVYIWDFGDGTPLYTSTPEDLETKIVYHTYNLPKLPDTITVTLTVSLPDGSCFATYTGKVLILGPIADFKDDGNRFPCPGSGRSINFQSTSTGNPTLYYWNFGDPRSGTANESHLKNPVHDYLRVGWYDVTHIVQDSMKCADTLIIPSHVFIDGPVGDVLYGELSGCVEHTVLFTPEIIWADSLWISPDRADLIKEGDTNINNTHLYTYQLPRAYVPYFYLIKWTLDEKDDSIRCVIEWEGADTIFVIDILPDFMSDSIYCPNYAVFPNTTAVLPKMLAIDSAMWSFGNGDSLSAIDGYTNYDSIGTYTVNMTVHVKKCTKQISKNIEVIDLTNTVLTEPDSANGCGNIINVLFTATLTDEVPDIFTPQYEWKFDDGDTITGNPVSKTFYSSEFYPYQTIVTFGSNCVITYFDTIRIRAYGYPTAEFEPTPQTVHYGEEIHFIDKSIEGEGILIYWYWDFSDSTNSNLQSPTHTYTGTSGYVTVFLWIEDQFGCRDSIEHDVLILETLDFPNILTPFGSDGKRYFFRPLAEKGYFKEFQIIIYDRWGMKVWKNSCKEPNCPDYGDSFWWDGTTKHGRPVEDGVYFWVVYAAPLSGTKPIIKNGSVTVVNGGKK